MYDIVIIGGGPAGLTAAVYALRAGRSVVVIEKNGFGGQIAYSPKVENIPGTIQISGAAFADQLVEQAMNLGADVHHLQVAYEEAIASSSHFRENLRPYRLARSRKIFAYGALRSEIRARTAVHGPLNTAQKRKEGRFPASLIKNNPSKSFYQVPP